MPLEAFASPLLLNNAKLHGLRLRQASGNAHQPTCLPSRPIKLPASRHRREPNCWPRPPLVASLIPASASYATYAVLACCAVTGQTLGTRTRAGRALSAPVVTMLAAVLLLNVGVLPVASPAVPPLQAAATRIATPLLLLGADLRVVFGRTRRLTAAFAFASLATVVGAFVGWFLVGKWMPQDGWQLAAALAAKNVGGGMNYLAVLDTYGASAQLLALGLSADNLIGLLYFPFNSWQADRHSNVIEKKAPLEENKMGASASMEAAAGARRAADTVTVPALTRTLALSLAIVAVSQLALPSAPIPAAAAITVLLATLFPGRLASLVPSGTALGSIALYSLFAAAGASGGTLRSLSRSPTGAAAAVAFCAILYTVHVALVAIAATVSSSKGEGKGEGRRLVLASNAAIGGPATAAALAESKGWEDAVVPATVVGQLGNAIGSWVGLGVGVLIVKIFAG